jgi:hypothetical protein
MADGSCLLTAVPSLLLIEIVLLWKKRTCGCASRVAVLCKPWVWSPLCCAWYCRADSPGAAGEKQYITEFVSGPDAAADTSYRASGAQDARYAPSQQQGTRTLAVPVCSLLATPDSLRAEGENWHQCQFNTASTSGRSHEHTPCSHPE